MKKTRYILLATAMPNDYMHIEKKGTLFQKINSGKRRPLALYWMIALVDAYVCTYSTKPRLSYGSREKQYGQIRKKDRAVIRSVMTSVMRRHLLLLLLLSISHNEQLVVFAEYKQLITLLAAVILASECQESYSCVCARTRGWLSATETPLEKVSRGWLTEDKQHHHQKTSRRLVTDNERNGTMVRRTNKRKVQV
jgi:hypothetical protein